MLSTLEAPRGLNPSFQVFPLSVLRLIKLSLSRLTRMVSSYHSISQATEASEKFFHIAGLPEASILYISPFA